jgi:AcrR family transcriptional regulator
MSRRGPQAGATRTEVLALVRAHLREGELVEMSSLARDCGVGRSTLHRWFGSRERLIALVLSEDLEATLRTAYATSRLRGGPRVAAAIERLLTDAATDSGFMGLLRTHPRTMLAAIMAGGEPVQETSIATVADLIALEAGAGRLVPALEPRILAFALVQVGQAFMWARAATGAPPDLAETMRVTRALLGC